MKKVIMMCLFWLSLSSAVKGQDQCSFTNKEGCVAHARITGYDALTGKINIETWATQQAEVRPGRNSILAEKEFLDPDTFQISIFKDPSDADATWTAWPGEGAGDRQAKIQRFKMNLKNTSDTNLKELTVKYCIYRNVTVGNESKISSQALTKRIGDIAKKESVGDFFLDSATSVSDPTGNFKSSVAGVIARIYMVTANGQDVVREVRYPETLSDKDYSWE